MKWIFLSFSAIIPAVSPYIRHPSIESNFSVLALPIQYVAETLLTPVSVRISFITKITTQIPGGKAHGFLITFFLCFIIL
jgi:hypothetical protein